MAPHPHLLSLRILPTVVSAAPLFCFFPPCFRSCAVVPTRCLTSFPALEKKNPPDRVIDRYGIQKVPSDRPNGGPRATRGRRPASRNRYDNVTRVARCTTAASDPGCNSVYRYPVPGQQQCTTVTRAALCTKTPQLYTSSLFQGSNSVQLPPGTPVAIVHRATLFQGSRSLQLYPGQHCSSAY